MNSHSWIWPPQVPVPSHWTTAASVVGVDPIEAKAVYVLGVLRNLLEGAGKCLDGEHKFWLPAYVLAADAAELIGRCHLGDAPDADKPGQRLEKGLRQVIGGDFLQSDSGHIYDVQSLKMIRNFAAHGASTPRGDERLDPGLVISLLNGAADEISRMWERWRAGDAGFVEKLARANIVAMWTDGTPVFIAALCDLLVDGADAGGRFLFDETWRSV